MGKNTIPHHVTQKERKDRELRLYYTLTILLGVGIFLYILQRNGFFSGSSAAYIQTLCDAAFISGLLLFSIWLIALSWYHGTLDIFLYSFALMVAPFQKEQDVHDKEKRNFVTYREQKKLERRAPTHLLVVGSAFLVISVIFYILLQVL